MCHETCRSCKEGGVVMPLMHMSESLDSAEAENQLEALVKGVWMFVCERSYFGNWNPRSIFPLT